MRVHATLLTFLCGLAVADLSAQTVLGHPPRCGIDDPNTPVMGGLRSRKPISFVANHGQWDRRVLYRTEGTALHAFLEERGLSLVLQRRGAEGRTGVAMRLSFDGAAQPVVSGEEQRAGVHNFLLGDEPAAWRTGVPSFAGVRYRGLYPGVDLVVRDADGNLEYDLHFAAGVEVGRAVMQVAGADRLELDSDGALRMKNAFADLIQLPPRSWQVRPDGDRLPLKSRYRLLDDGRYVFEVDGRDPALPLVVDPIVTWATYIGGDGDDLAVAVDRSSNGLVTVAGRTDSLNFPVSPGAFQTTHGGGTWDAFVIRFDPSKQGTSQRVWATYIGGKDDDTGLDVVVDAAGNATLVGFTFSTDYPTSANAFQRTKVNNNAVDPDAVISQLDSTGGIMLYSSFFGGNNVDYANSLELDPRNPNVLLISGYTMSQGNVFPIKGAAQPTFGGARDGFVARLDISQALPSAQLQWSTYLGGNQLEGFWSATTSPWNLKDMSLDVESNGDVAVVLQTDGGNFPGQNRCPGGPGLTSCVAVTRYNANGTLRWTRLVGGAVNNGWSIPQSVRVDPADGAVTVAGLTYANDFPTTAGAMNRVMSTQNGPGNGQGHDGFFFRVSSDGRTLLYSTLMGGTFANAISGHYLESSGAALMVGWTIDDYMTTPGCRRPCRESWDGVLVRLDPKSQGFKDLRYSSYFGGSGRDRAWDIARAVDGACVAVGTTNSSDLPVSAGAFQNVLNAVGPRDSWAGSLDPLHIGVERVGTSSPGCARPIFIDTPVWPQRSFAAPFFALNCTGAPASTSGWLVIGTPTQISLPPVTLYVNPVIVLNVSTNSRGFYSMSLPIPPTVPAAAQVDMQFVFNGSPSCGPLQASHAVEITIQP